MQFFIDTGDVEEIRQAAELGIIDGVTTNPSLIAKTGRDLKDVMNEIITLVDGPISAEVYSTTAPEMINEGKEYAKMNDNIVIKLPLTPEGIKACNWFSANNIKTNVTLCFSCNQALLAAKSGATYISPFIGRLDDIGHQGTDLIREIRVIYDNYGYSTQILAASIRHAEHVRNVALAGADVATMPYSVIKSLFKHPLTDIGLEKFLSDYRNSQK